LRLRTLHLNGKYRVGIGDGTNYTWSSNVLDLSDLEWHHVCISITSSEMKIYRDAVLVETVDVSSIADLLLNAKENLTIARGLAGYTNGIIDETRIYNRSLSADEVFDHYAKGFTKYESITPTITIIGSLTLNKMKSTWGYFNELKCRSDKLTIFGGVLFKIFNTFGNRIYMESFSYYGNYNAFPTPQWLSQPHIKQQIERYMKCNYVSPLQILTTPIGTLWTITITVALLIGLLPFARKRIYRYAK